LDWFVQPGDEEIILQSGSTYRLYEGTRLNFGTEANPLSVFLADVVEPGETTIPILPSTAGIYPGSRCTLDTPIPLFSAKVVNADNAMNFFSDQGFSNRKIAGRVSGITASGTASGAWVHTDPGYAAVRKAIKNGLMCKIQVLDAYGRGGQWAQAFFGLNRGRAVNQFTNLDYKIIVTGKWEDIYPNGPARRVEVDWPYYCQQVLPDYTIIPDPNWLYYCPQVVPDYAINFTIVYSGTDSSYCPQTIPDYAIGNQDQKQVDTNYCPQNTSNFFNIDFTIVTSTQTDTGYCPQDASDFYVQPITYCAQDTSSLPNPYSPIPADGTVLYCQQDTSSLPNPYSPIPADGTIVYCQQDTSGLPTP
jgi:hypothetical protein